MKKDVVFSMRMTSETRKALGEAARKDHRSVASLLDKIISDYLHHAGFLISRESPRDLRRFRRKKIHLPARIVIRTETDRRRLPIAVLDISSGGVLVTYPKERSFRLSLLEKSSQFELCIPRLYAEGELRFDCETRHIHDHGNNIKLGAAFFNLGQENLKLLGAYLN